MKTKITLEKLNYIADLELKIRSKNKKIPNKKLKLKQTQNARN